MHDPFAFFADLNRWASLVNFSLFQQTGFDQRIHHRNNLRLPQRRKHAVRAEPIEFPLSQFFVFRSAQHLGDERFSKTAVHSGHTTEHNADAAQQRTGIDAFKFAVK